MSDAIKILNELDLIFSKTPIIKIVLTYKNKEMQIYGKYEAFGLSGSGKDRMARFVVKDAYQKGLLHKGDMIVDVTSGNAGIALSHIARLLGNYVTVFIPNWMSNERFKILSALGTQIVKVSEEEGGFLQCYKMMLEKSKEDGVFSTKQFENKLNIQAHLESTMPELFSKLSFLDVTPNVFVAGYGTGGMVMAASDFVKSHNIPCKVYPLEPKNMALLSEGKKVRDVTHTNHKIEGIMDDFVPALLDPKKLEAPVLIDEDDSIIVAQQVNKMGVSFGISSGANLCGCVKQLYDNNESIGATIFCDGSGKYLSTDLFKQLQIQDHYISRDIKIKNLEFISSR